MFSLSAANSLYAYVGVLLLMVELPLFMFGLPPFHYGIWLQTEPDMTALFTLTTLDALWLGYGLLLGRLQVLPAPPKLFYVLLAWLLWQLVPTVFAFNPHKSWFGPVEMGEGMAWHLASFIITLKTIPLWQAKRLRDIAMVTAGLTLCVESLMHVLFSHRTNVYIPGVWIPAQWGAYLAFMAGYFWIMMMAGGYVRKPAVYGILIFFIMDVVVVSYNKTAIALMPLALLVSLGFYLYGRRKDNPDAVHPTKFLRLLVVLASIGPMAWVGLTLVYKAEDTGEVTDSMFHLSHKDGSLGSRVGLNQVGAWAMAEEPRRWLVGSGWGDFNDTMFKYALVDGVRMYYKGERKPNWAFVDGNAYHSHCQPLEALLALGLPGFLLWMALPIVMILSVPGRLFWQVTPVMVVVTAVGYFWFQLPQCVPIMAMMWGALCVTCREREDAPTRRRALPLTLAMTLCAVLMTLTTTEQFRGMQYGERLFKGTRTHNVADFPLDWILQDLLRGGDRLRVSAMGYALSLDKENGDFDMRQHDWYKQLMDAADAMMVSAYAGPRSRYLPLWLEYKLLLNLGYPIFEDLGSRALADIRRSVLTVAKGAPWRDDIASFYFLNIEDVTHGDKKLQEEIYRELLSVAPNHRSAKWLLGHLLLAKGEKAEAEQLLREAVRDGVQRVYPITDAQLAPWL